MREVLFIFIVALVIGAIINGYQSQTAVHSPNTTGSATNSGLVQAISQNNFDSDVLNSQTPVLVDFWATWCGPCKQMSPVIEDLAKEYEGRMKVVKIDIDAEPELAAKFNVTGVPTFILFKGGKPLTILSGAMPKESLDSAIQHLL